jgi:hypothetical protein
MSYKIRDELTPQELMHQTKKRLKELVSIPQINFGEQIEQHREEEKDQELL